MLRRALSLAVIFGCLPARANAQDADAGIADAEIADAGIADPPIHEAAPLEVTREPQLEDKKLERKKLKHKKLKRKRKLRKGDGFHLHTEAAVSGGGLLGYRERPGSLGVLDLSAEVEPSLRVDHLSLALPISFAHRQTFPADLVENRGRAMLEAEYRIARPIRLGLHAGVALRDRPGWPDLYQPTSEGLAPTDRYSSWTRRVGGSLTLHPAPKHWIRFKYDYRIAIFTHDPAFEAVARPNHLTPFDYDRHKGELDYHVRLGRVRLGVGAQAYWKSSFYVFARDAHTGFSHAGPGGRPANPLQEVRGLTPFFEADLALIRKHLTLELRYAHELREDLYQGYYSWSGPNPRVALRVQPVRRLELTAAAELWMRRYGSGSYVAGLGHPALDEGDRRRDDRLALELDGLLRLHPSIALTLEAGYVLRDTSFPDYEPFIFPASQAYAIAWDYTNVRIEAGVTVRKNWL